MDFSAVGHPPLAAVFVVLGDLRDGVPVPALLPMLMASAPEPCHLCYPHGCSSNSTSPARTRSPATDGTLATRGFAGRSPGDVAKVFGPNVLLPGSRHAPLTMAANVGHPGCVRAIVAAGGDPNKLDGFHWTPLYWAAHTGKADALRALLRCGADPNCATKSGRTPLCCAAYGGQLECVRALVEGGADPRRADADGTPLDVATKQRKQPVVAYLQGLLDPSA